MQLVDSHCHLDLIRYDDDLSGPEAAVLAAQAADVSHLLTISTTLKTFPDIHAIAMRFPHVYCSVGVHPHNEVREAFTRETLVALAQKEKVVALGETGLDYYYTHEERAVQQHNFRLHIQAAREVGKPLIVHTRAAQADTLMLLTEERADLCGGVMHCFTESWEMAKQALDLGFYISISGIVTFKNATEVQAVAKAVPLDRLLVETDSPFLAPVPHRGKQNQPAYVRFVAEFIANLRGISLAELAKASSDNFFRLFSGATR